MKFCSERSIICFMRVATGKVVDGKVVIEGLPLDEGSRVTVLTREGEEAFQVSPEEEAELLLSIAEADRGEVVLPEKVLLGLPRHQP